MEHRTYAEQIVKCKKGGAGVLAQMGAVLAAIIVLAVIMFIPQIAVLVPALAVLTVLAAFLVIRNVNYEYEYQMAESQLTVDMIRGKSRRKRVLAYDVKSFDHLAPLDTEDIARLKASVQTVYDVSGHEGKKWYALFSAGGEAGRCLIVFSPNERMLDMLFRYVPPRNVKR